jgi:hypothetical protein
VRCEAEREGVVESGMSLERAADWGRRDGFAAALRKNLGSASLGKDKEAGGNIGQCARSLQCLEPQQSLHL